MKPVYTASIYFGMKVLANIPDEAVRWLDAEAKRRGSSRAALIRQAVDKLRTDATRDWLEVGFGLWKHRTDIGDAVEWQRRIRAEWTRPWDDDYEEVKAEFPDLFDEDDDRERQRYLEWEARRSTRTS